MTDKEEKLVDVYIEYVSRLQSRATQEQVIISILAREVLARKERGDMQSIHDKTQQERIEHWQNYHKQMPVNNASLWGKEYHDKTLGSDYDIDKTNDVNHEHPYEDSKPKQTNYHPVHLVKRELYSMHNAITHKILDMGNDYTGELREFISNEFANLHKKIDKTTS